jgi:hypothetical protein
MGDDKMMRKERRAIMENIRSPSTLAYSPGNHNFIPSTHLLF